MGANLTTPVMVYLWITLICESINKSSLFRDNWYSESSLRELTCFWQSAITFSCQCSHGELASITKHIMPAVFVTCVAVAAGLWCLNCWGDTHTKQANKLNQSTITESHSTNDILMSPSLSYCLCFCTKINTGKFWINEALHRLQPKRKGKQQDFHWLDNMGSFTCISKNKSFAISKNIIWNSSDSLIRIMQPDVVSLP